MNRQWLYYPIINSQVWIKNLFLTWVSTCIYILINHKTQWYKIIPLPLPPSLPLTLSLHVITMYMYDSPSHNWLFKVSQKINYNPKNSIAIMSNQLSSHTNYFLIIILVVFHSLGSTSLYLLRGILVGLLASLCEPACALAICWSFCNGNGGGGEEEADDEETNASFIIIIYTWNTGCQPRLSSIL